MKIKIEAALRLKITAAVSAEDISDMKEDELVAFVKKASPAELKKLMFAGGYGAQELFPSGWAYACAEAPYPAKLAQILVKSKDQESFTDLANCFYNKNRKMEPAAMEVFLKSVLALKPDDLAFQLSSGEASTLDDLPGSNLANGIEQFAKREPGMLKKILMKLPEKTRAELAEENDTDPAIVKLLK